MDEKPYVIFAPHVDDEMIGCWSLLQERKVSDVYYFFELTDTRRAEAESVAYEFGFTAHFMGLTASPPPVEAGKTILAPSKRDQHPDHKRVNKWAQF